MLFRWPMDVSSELKMNRKINKLVRTFLLHHTRHTRYKTYDQSNDPQYLNWHKYNVVARPFNAVP